MPPPKNPLNNGSAKKLVSRNFDKVRLVARNAVYKGLPHSIRLNVLPRLSQLLSRDEFQCANVPVFARTPLSPVIDYG